MRRYLVVANQTLGGEPLERTVHEVIAQGPCRFHIVVPATPPQEHLTWVEGRARAIAQQRLDAALERVASFGVEVAGEVGDANPILAVGDALLADDFDEIIVSTLPPGASRWLRRDLPHRLEERYGLPVRLVIGRPEPAAAN
jgi:GABA permease